MSNEQSSDVSIREVLIKGKEYFNYLKKRWFWIPIFMIPFLAYTAWESVNHKVQYQASLSFMINEEDSGGIGAISQVLGQFGGMIGGSKGYNYDKILELAKSRKIIERVLFDSIEINNREDYLANHFLDMYADEDFYGKIRYDELKEFRFNRDDISLFQETEKSVLKTIHSKIIGNANTSTKDRLLTVNYSDKTGIMKLYFQSESQNMSVLFLNKEFENLSEFYVEKMTEKQQETYDVFENKVDSVQLELAQTEYALANMKDSNRKIYLKQDLLRQDQLQRKIQMNYVILAEVVKNKELADYTLKNTTPFIQAIDLPMTPLKPLKYKLIQNAVASAFVGGVFFALFFGLKKFLKDLKI